jgi:hypothetical protein
MHTHATAFTHTNIYTYTRNSSYTYRHIYIHTQQLLHIQTYIHTHATALTHTNIYTYTRNSFYTYRHIYIHTYTQGLLSMQEVHLHVLYSGIQMAIPLITDEVVKQACELATSSSSSSSTSDLTRGYKINTNNIDYTTFLTKLRALYEDALHVENVEAAKAALVGNGTALQEAIRAHNHNDNTKTIPEQALRDILKRPPFLLPDDVVTSALRGKGMRLASGAIDVHKFLQRIVPGADEELFAPVCGHIHTYIHTYICLVGFDSLLLRACTAL